MGVGMQEDMQVKESHKPRPFGAKGLRPWKRSQADKPAHNHRPYLDGVLLHYACRSITMANQADRQPS